MLVQRNYDSGNCGIVYKQRKHLKICHNYGFAATVIQIRGPVLEEMRCCQPTQICYGSRPANPCSVLHFLSLLIFVRFSCRTVMQLTGFDVQTNKTRKPCCRKKPARCRNNYISYSTWTGQTNQPAGAESIRGYIQSLKFQMLQFA